jgi:EAL domain-containing protein (putative c-di-GMP-specific phosphodiesterase class I)
VAARGLDISVSVNVSARHLQEPDFAQRLGTAGAATPNRWPPYLETRMLETAAHADIDATSALLARCRGWACASRSTTSAPATPR